MAADRRSSDFGAIGTLGGTTAIPGSDHLGMTRERRQWILAALGLLAVAVVAWVIFHQGPVKPPPVPAIPVAEAKVMSQDLLDDLASQEAFGRGAEPWEVASVMIFLASDYASYLTGEVIAVSSQHP